MQDTDNKQSIDFDKWARLAKEDPEAYEAMRKQMIQDVIDSTSPEVRRRMECLQWQIDQVRNTSPNPMASCLKISQMMWDRVVGENGLLDNMEQLNSQDPIKPQKSRPSANIIDINKPKKD